MITEVEQILNELYEIDPAYRQYETEIIKLIEFMLKNKPQTNFDVNFKNELRIKLLHKIEEIEKSRKQSIFWGGQLWRVLALTSTIAVLLLIFVYNLPLTAPLLKAKLTQKSAEEQINILPDQAFGNFGLQAESSAPMLDSGLATSSTVSLGYGGGRGDLKMLVPPSAGYIEPGIVYPQDIYVPKLSYVGEKIEITDDNVDIYKKVETKSSDILNIAKITLSGIDLNKFKSLVLNNITIDENIDFGYSISFGSMDNTISINQNWLKWPVLQGQTYQPMQASELLSAQDAINIANKFIEQYKINMNNYGQAELDNSWRVFYEAAPTKADYPMPEWQTVRYPLIFKGKTVYDEGGRKVGIDVSIDARQKRVSSLYGLSSPKYQASAYEVEKDWQKILDFAIRGGVNYYGPIYEDGSSNVKEFKVELGTPDVQLMRYFRYQNNTTEELIIPALIFPIIRNEHQDFYPNDNVVVPIVKDIIESITYPNYPVDDARPVSTPLMIK